MAFEDVTFPQIKLKHGVSKTVLDPVSTITNGTVEYRNARTRYERFNWKIQAKNLLVEDKEEIRKFLSARGHALTSFKFRDPDIDRLDNAILEYYSGSGNSNWKLALPYSDSTPGSHILLHVDTSGSPTASATVNGSSESIMSVDEQSDGTPTVQIANSDDGDTVRITTPIYFAVRLNNTISYVISALDRSNQPSAHAFGEINLIEVFES